MNSDEKQYGRADHGARIRLERKVIYTRWFSHLLAWIGRRIAP